MLRLVALLLCLAAPAQAEEVVVGLSQNRVAINTNFDGSEILVFGAVKREAQPPDGPIHVVVTIQGPSEPVVVRRKDRRLGIWANTDAVEIDRAPTFYAVATSGPWKDVILETEDLRHKVSIEQAIRLVGTEVTDRTNFIDALIRIREENGLYQTKIGAIDLVDGTLFRTSVALPANLTEGTYTTRFFLTRGGAVIDSRETTIFVQKVGLERFLFILSREQPLIYGILSLAIAIAAGWGASAVFRYMRS